jgi:transcription initiation factor TFIIB
MQQSISCALCNNDLTVTDPDSGEIICSKCGLVIIDKIQESSRPEYRVFSSHEVNKKNRSGTATSLAYHDMGLSTVIGKTDRDADGHKIDAGMHCTMERLRTWDFRIQIRTSTHRNLVQAFSELNVLKDKLALPDAVIEKTAYIYRKIQERGLVKGRSISGLVAASVYAACREMGIPRSLTDIAVASNVKRKDLARAYRILVIELDIKIPLIDEIKCLVKVANKANLSEKTKRQAISIMNEILKKDISAGKNPMGFAATVLYLSCLKTGENITQIDISHAAGVTEVTLRNRYKDLKSHFS